MWKPRPDHERLRAERFIGDGQWERCEYADLKNGDVFRAVHPNGHLVNPLTIDALEDGEDMVALCHGDPIKGYEGNDGFAVDISVGSLKDLMAEVVN
ncbi:MAG: hypothetical protein KGO96_10120 [Elusimicrobia bacterium]|nr:hypothetical protein [Elusimicrobiota bacterium]